MKGLLAVVGVVLVLGLGAFFFSQKGSTPASQSEIVGAGGSETVVVPESKGPAPTLVNSLKDAMGLGRNMRCTYTGGTGDAAYTSTAYVDGQKFRSETEVSGAKMTVLSDGETQYVWGSGDKQGFKMSKACLASLAGANTPTDSQAARPKNYEAALDTAQDVRCEAAGTTDFSVPTDVTFTDQCAMLEQSRKMMEQYQGKLPVGTYPGQ